MSVCYVFVFVAQSRKSLQDRDEKIQELEKTVYELRSVSHDGIFVWRICNFRRMLSAIRAGQSPPSFYSQPFFTHQFGYKLCGRIYLNGDGTGRGSHVSLFIVVMQVNYRSLIYLFIVRKLNSAR